MTRSAVSPWIVRRNVADPPARLICIPYAGGGPSAYREWNALVPHDVELCFVRLPGRESRLLEPPMTDLDELCEALAEALLGWLDAPYAFVGDCAGAIVVLEVTRLLRSRGCPLPLTIYAAACPAPQLPRRAAPLHDLPADELVREVGLIGAMDPFVFTDPELFALVEPMLRADLLCMERSVYRPDSPLPIPITIFGGTQDEFVSPEQLLAWREQTTSAFTLRLVDANHFLLTSAAAMVTKLLVDDFRAVVQAARDSSRG